jgi:hypothetical protein
MGSVNSFPDDFSSRRSADPASQRPSQTPSPGFDHPGDDHTFGKAVRASPTFLKSSKCAHCGDFHRPEASRRCGRRCCLGCLDSSEWRRRSGRWRGGRRRSGLGSRRYCGQPPCFAFLPAFIPFAPRSGLVLGRLWFELGGVRAFVLLAPRSDLALDRFQLLTCGPGWKALLKRAARFVFACRFGSLKSSFSRHHGPSWNPIIFDFARHRGRRRSGPDRCMSARQHDNENGSCDRVGNDNDDAGSPQPALLTLAIQQSVVGCSLLRMAKDFNSSCDLAEPTRGIRIARVEVGMVCLRCFAIRLDQGLIVSIRTNTEQIIVCSHRYAFERRRRIDFI